MFKSTMISFCGAYQHKFDLHNFLSGDVFTTYELTAFAASKKIHRKVGSLFLYIKVDIIRRLWLLV